MNTRASVAYGWGILIAAGGGAYYFAKRSINADRAERAAAEERRRMAAWDAKFRDYDADNDHPSPSVEAKRQHNQDPAPGDESRAPPGYASSKPYRSPRGDRFS